MGYLKGGCIAKGNKPQSICRNRPNSSEHKLKSPIEKNWFIQFILLHCWKIHCINLQTFPKSSTILPNPFAAVQYFPSYKFNWTSTSWNIIPPKPMLFQLSLPHFTTTILFLLIVYIPPTELCCKWHSKG